MKNQLSKKANSLVSPFLFVVFIFILPGSYKIAAQTLQSGDIAIVGWNTNNFVCDATYGNILSVVFLVDVAPSTTLMITDNGFNRICNNLWGNTEGVIVFVTPSSTTIPAGTVIHFAINTSGNGSVYTTAPYSSPYSTGWTIFKKSGTAGNFALAHGTSCASNQGDQVYIFKDSLWTNNTGNGHNATTGTPPIYGFNCKTAWNSCYNNSTNSGLHPADTCYSFTANSALCPTPSFIHYTGPTTAASKLIWWLRIRNPVNWTGYSNCTNYNASSPFIPSSISIIGTDTASIACSNNCTSCGSTTATLIFTLPVGNTFDVTYTDGTNSYTASSVTNGSTVNQVVSSTKTYTISSVKISGANCPLDIATTSTATITITPAPIVIAGPDISVCTESSAYLFGSIEGNATTFSWSTNGTGSFSNSNILNPQYTPSPADVAAGSVILTLTADDPDGAGICTSASDQMVVTLYNPSAPSATGGAICGTGSVTLSASGCPGGTIKWYDSSIGGTLLGSGSTYIASPSVTTRYYAECVHTSCHSPRTEVYATVYPFLTPPSLSASMNPICTGQSVVFTASGGTGLYQFFVNGVSQGAPSGINTFTSSTLSNGDVVSVKCISQIQYDGLISSAEGWGGTFFTSSGGATPGFGSGHEINALYVMGSSDSLRIGLAGNVQNNNRILLFIDSKSGGYNNGNFGRLGAVNGLDNYNAGNQFDVGFLPDYCLSLGTNAAHNDFTVDLYTLSGTAGSGGGPNYFLGNDLTISNPIGVIPSSNNFDFIHGFEVGLLKSDIGYTSGGLKMMAMYIGNSGFLSNQFLTPANIGEENYGNSIVDFGSAAPNPINIPAEVLSNNCVSTAASVTMSVQSFPVVDAGTYSTVCINAPDVQLSGTPSGGTFSGIGVTGNSFDPSVGTQTIIYTYSDATGCSNLDQATITVDTIPTVNAGTYGPLCANESPITLGNGTPSGGTYSGIGVTNNTFNPEAGTQTINYTYSNGACSNSASTLIVVNTPPVVNAGTYGPLCSNGADITLNGGTPTGGTYSGIGVTGNSFDPSVGTQTITYTYSNGTCSNTANTIIIVNNGFDQDGDGYTNCNGDCNDNNPYIHPGATEICNSLDDNCNGQIDEGGAACTTPVNPVTLNIQATTADLNWLAVPCAVQYRVQFRLLGDTSYTNGPFVSVPNISVTLSGLSASTTYQWRVRAICNNGSSTPNTSPIIFTTLPPPVPWYQDADGDGYGNPAVSITASLQPQGYVSDHTDCYDIPGIIGPTIHPGASEICDNLDNNCNGQIDEGVDGSACSVPTGLVTSEITYHSARVRWYRSECVGTYKVQYRIQGAPNYTNGPTVNFPDTTAVLEGLAESTNYQWRIRSICFNGSSSAFSLFVPFTTPSSTPTWYADIDEDGYGDPASTTIASTQPPGYVAGNTDCNDANVNIHPGATEYCNGIDDDCDGLTDESAIDCPTPTGQTVTTITATKARLNWLASNCATTYNVQYRVRGTSTWSSRNVNTLYLQLSNLLPGTQYEWRVRAKCGLYYSAFTTPLVRFTTLASLVSASNDEIQTIDKSAQKSMPFERSPHFSVSPNPSNGLFNVHAEDLANGTSHIKVMDQLGKTCYLQTVSVTKGEIQLQIDLTSLSSGLYFILLLNGNEVWGEKVSVW